MQPLRLVGLGCGSRTRTYLRHAAALPERFLVVGAADPLEERRAAIRQFATGDHFFEFPDAETLLAQPRFAEIAVVGTQDVWHYRHCLKALEAGYDVLLEKPIATSLAEIFHLEDTARRLQRRVLVCHVLRYSDLFRTLKQVVASGKLGEIVSFHAVEGVERWHQAHSFVRGHWADTRRSNPMILSKSCHDLDLLLWIIDKPCRKVSSFGARQYFTAANAPAGAPARCTDGCPVGESCPFNALLYLDQHRPWLHHIYDQAETASRQEVTNWLRESPWGRCVFACDNNTVDRQVVAMEFEDGVSGSFHMTAFAKGRSWEIQGTNAVLRAGFQTREDTGFDIIVQFHSGLKETITLESGDGSGHGGADAALVLSLFNEMNRPDPEKMSTGLSLSVASHVLGFAAEESRLRGTVVDVEDFSLEQRATPIPGKDQRLPV